MIATLGVPQAGEVGASLIAGVLSAIVLGRAAHLRRDVPLALVAFGAVVASGGTAMVAADLARSSTVVVLASVFVFVELVALAVRKDEFWARPVSAVTFVAEMVAAGATLHTVFLLFRLNAITGADRLVGVSCALAAIAWAFATYRYLESTRDGIEWRLTALAGASSTIVAVHLMSRSPLAGSITMLGVGALLLASRHPLTDAGGQFAMTTAVWSVSSELGYPFGVIAALCTVAAACVAFRELRRQRGGMLVVSSVVLLAGGAIRGADHLPGVVATLSFVAAAWVLAEVLDRFDGTFSSIPRIAAVISLVTTSQLVPQERLAVTAVLIALFTLDTVWTNDGRLLYGLAIPLQVAVVDIGLLAGLDVAFIGVSLCVAALVWAGLGEVVDGEVRAPATVTAGLGSVAGILVSASDPVALGISFLVTGGAVIGLAVLQQSVGLGYFGGLLVLAGTLTELAAADVAAVDAYVAPVALYLLGAGAAARRRSEMSSWVAYAPAVALMGTTSFVERINGGSGWHAIAAGAVGVAAVAVGGWRRLAGPLFVGTALLACVVGFESLAVTATVPTWGWLAIGGGVLLATGIMLERRDLTPAAAGRRVVEVIAANFD
jgi:hypothetical protein